MKQLTDEMILRGPLSDILKSKIPAVSKVFVVCSKHFREKVAGILEGREVMIFSDYTPNPDIKETLEATELCRKGGYDIIVGIGGGSALDTAKCVKENLGAKLFILVPTTAGTGSEATRTAIVYKDGEKLSLGSDDMLPDLVILDGSLISSLPDYHKKAALADSLCQAIESFWSQSVCDESRQFSVKCVDLILDNYKDFIDKGEKNDEMILAADYSGRAINLTKTTAAHAMCYKLTTMYGAAHGHAVASCMLPLWRFHAELAKEDESLRCLLMHVASLVHADSIEESIKVFEDFLGALDLPRIDVKKEDLIYLASSVNTERLRNNPVPMTTQQIEYVYGQI